MEGLCTLLKRHQNSGVTLIEMLIGLIIITIGMTVAVPSFQGMVARNNVATEVNEMLLAINLARSEASRTGSRMSVQAITPEEDNEFGAGFCVVPATQGNCDANVVRSFPAVSTDATLNFVDAGGATAVNFTARGGLDGVASVSLDYCYEGQQGRRIFISPIGRAKSYRPINEVPEALRPDC
ncbi:MAG: GspH/FimT family pseudopilin [Pseudomonadales bacterium]